MTDEDTLSETTEKAKDDRRIHLAATYNSIINTWVGLGALFVIAIGLAVAARSGWPLVIIGLGVLVSVAEANYRRSVQQTAEREAARENCEVVKLAFENAVRAHFVADGHPMMIAQMMGEAVMAGVSQRELQEIVNRVHASAHPDCVKDDEAEPEGDDQGS